MTAPEPQAAPRPPPRRRLTAAQRAYAFLVSPRLAIALLVGVLACLVVGVTILRGERAWALIFSTLWFNSLLVLLAISAAAAFFTRIWKRKLTVVSAGLILFHICFVALLGGVVYRSLYSFEGVMRLSEGETLQNGRMESYDSITAGRLFDFDRLPGTTTLLRMHRDYKVGGDDKRAAYEIAVEDGPRRASKVIYITEFMDFLGMRFFCQKEGYTILVTLSDAGGKELYGAFVPLQSLMQANGTHMYATGSAMEALPFRFPPAPEPSRMELLLTYWPGQEHRTGQVSFKVRPLLPDGKLGPEAVGMVQVGQPWRTGDLVLKAVEVRYWVGMTVRTDPGLGVIMGSLAFGLLGSFLTLVGRLRQGARKAVV
jgi:hypothetical protein